MRTTGGGARRSHPLPPGTWVHRRVRIYSHGMLKTQVSPANGSTPKQQPAGVEGPARRGPGARCYAPARLTRGPGSSAWCRRGGCGLHRRGGGRDCGPGRCAGGHATTFDRPLDGDAGPRLSVFPLKRTELRSRCPSHHRLLLRRRRGRNVDGSGCAGLHRELPSPGNHC